MKTIHQAAADWWADEALHPSKDFYRETFRNMLLVRLENNPNWEILCNDYDPEGILLEAVQKAGIECAGCMFSGNDIFPRKTRLYQRDGKLFESVGRGSQHVEVWPERKAPTAPIWKTK